MGPRGLQAPAFLVLSALAQLLTLALTIVAAHLLDAGHYSEVMALLAAFGAVALPTTALQVVAARHLASHPPPTDAPPRAPSPEPTGFVAQVRRGLAVALPLSSLVVVLPLAAWAPRLHLAPLPLAALGLLAWNGGTLLAWWRAQLQARHRFARLGAALAVEALARLLVFVALVGLTSMAPSWAWLAAVAGATAAAGAVLRGAARDPALDAPRIHATPALRGARAALLTALVGGAFTSLDLLWGRAVLPALQAGHFAAGTLASRPMLLLASVAGTVALPSAARGHIRLAGLVRAAALLALLGLAVAATLWALAPAATRLLFPASYAGAVPSFRAAALGSVGVAAALFLANATLGLSRPRGQTSLAVIVAAVAVAVFLWARTPAAFWCLAGGAGAVHLLWVATLARRWGSGA